MSAVGISRKVYEYFKNRMVGTIYFEHAQNKCRVWRFGGMKEESLRTLSKTDPKKVQLLNLYTIIAQNHDSVTGALI